MTATLSPIWIGPSALSPTLALSTLRGPASKMSCKIGLMIPKYVAAPPAAAPAAPPNSAPGRADRASDRTEEELALRSPWFSACEATKNLADRPQAKPGRSPKRSPLKNDHKVALSRGGIFRQSRGLYCPRFRKSITLRVRVVRDFSGLLDRANPATPDSAGTVAPQSGMPACDNSDGH